MKSTCSTDYEIGDNTAPDKRLELWKSRSFWFRLRHRWNVLSAFAEGSLTWHHAKLARGATSTSLAMYMAWKIYWH